jgi:MFS family permease
MKEGLMAGRNPKLALAYASSFAARGDSAVVTTFLSLWVYQDALRRGASDPDALSRAGIVSGVAQTCALAFAPIAGIICDKMHRVLALAVVSAIAACGYLLICTAENPLGVWIMIGACVVGCGEIGLVVSSTALVAQVSY